MAHKLAFLHALSPLHSGTGQGVGSIDLPIARERATNLPLVPGSSIKGSLRDALRSSLDPEVLKAVFGPERADGAGEHAGALRVGDAHLLLLPVRCLGHAFVWVTCPFVLQRFRRDATAAGHKDLPDVPLLKDCEALTAATDPLVMVDKQPKLVLEEFDFATKTGGVAVQWQEWLAAKLFDDSAWRDELRRRFAIVDDQSFDHLAEFATEVTAHIAIDDTTGTVADGALWYQEALPAETVLSLLLQSDDSRRKGTPLTGDEVLAKIPAGHSVQFGGKATTVQVTQAVSTMGATFNPRAPLVLVSLDIVQLAAESHTA